MPENSEIDAVYACLATQHGLGGVGIERLLARFGDAAGVYSAGPGEWMEAHPRLGESGLQSLRRGPDLKAWEALAAQCRELGASVTAPGLDDYPEPLRALPAPPPILYTKGRWRPEDASAVALVGTRDPTEYGYRVARGLARDFARAGYCVVSGLAAGIDGAAHAGALEGGGRTIAVIGCGLDIPYPLENLAVRARIEADDCARGLVVSEFPPGIEPRAGHFPRRNRLISALARAVVVVEAGGKSGALLTAEYAREQGRPLFAVPGPIYSAVSAGTNALLRRDATMALSVREVIDVLEGRAPRRAPLPEPAPYDVETIPRPRGRRAEARKGAAKNPPANPGLRPGARKNAPGSLSTGPEGEIARDPVTDLWEDEATCGLDALAARAVARGLWPADKAPNALLEKLLQLELQGRVRRLPGAVYRRA